MRKRGATPRLAAALAVALVLPGAAAAQQAPVTLAALGDSLTQGYGLPEAEGFVPQLQAWLDSHSDVPVTVVNAGVSGDTTAGGLARIDWTLTPEVNGVIVALGGNDVLRGIDPAVSRANLDGILARIDAAGLPALLVGMRAPANFGPEYQQAFDAIYPELAQAHGAALYPFFLQGLGAGEDMAAARGLMQVDNIHPDAEGVKRIVADMGPAVLELVHAAAR
ncbi:arylesterase [Paroceanicella profunda]|uniref:Arylesterase n=1 Tax=Paroceanicella profunda TaxID=2579971 RepID=A0A5B8FW44_9RHOB|nr:arylesterase [Paroceanicella profunda]QDL90729.1 arylesterase [Paroceanicella profunda]